jgi:hypothetical protein
MGRIPVQVSQFRLVIWPYVQFTDLSCFFQFVLLHSCLVCVYMECASNIVRIIYKNSVSLGIFSFVFLILY